MGLRVRIAAVAVVTVLSGGMAGCSISSAAVPHPTATPAPAATNRPPAAAALATPTPSATPSPASSRLAGPQLRVRGAPVKVKAKGALLADAATGQVLWSRDETTARPMASVTKVMTALLVLESGHLSEKIRVPKAAFKYAWKYGGETAGLHPGDVLTARELLAALLLPSGADAAYTLAAAFGPGLSAFVARMNAAAAQMGLRDTHFASPDGLPYPTETSTYSTPYDLVQLGRAAMRFAAFRSIVDRSFYHLSKGPGHHQYWWDNTNALIGTYPGAAGIKDGFTDKAGHCLLFEAVRHGRTLIGVVLGSPATGVAAGAQAAAQMLNWGFSLRTARQAGTG
jgi:serine-type D-Ala-D-Ala carboxypeptidase (penicillin-binding protein 5/6)